MGTSTDLAYRVATDLQRIAGELGRDPLVLASEIIIAQERFISFGYGRTPQPDPPDAVPDEAS